VNPILFIHDYDHDELDSTQRLLERGLTVAAWDVRATSSRRLLLDGISKLDRGAKALALVDLCAEDGEDHEYRGLRIIETIRHHPRLSQRVHPVALTRHARPEILMELEQAGAVATIHKRAFEASDTGEIAETLTSISTAQPTSWAARSTMRTIPGRDGLAVSGEDELSVWKDMFGTLRHSNLRRQILLGRAAGTPNADLASAAYVSEKTVEKHVREMQDHLAPRYQVGTVPTLLPAAHELLCRCVQLGPLSADLTRLPLPRRVKAWFDDPDIRRDAWIDPEADAELAHILRSPPRAWKDAADNPQRVTRGVLALLDAAAEYRR
jgi:DNA-binding NarL/FixJ family response regulator